MSVSHQFCTFHLASMLFGVEVSHVQEVLRFQPMTAVPLAPPVVRGLINLRGQIVTAIDLRVLLDIEPAHASTRPSNIIVRTEAGTFSLLVDRIGDVLELDPGCSELPPQNLDGKAGTLIDRTYQLNEGLMLSMNLTEVLATDTLSPLSSREFPGGATCAHPHNPVPTSHDATRH